MTYCPWQFLVSLSFILVLNNEDIQFGVWRKFHVLFFERQPQGLEAVRASWWWWLWGGDETSTSGIMVNTNTIGPAPQNMVGATTIIKKPTAQIALEQNFDARGRFIRSKETEKSVNAELDPRPAFHRHIFIFLTKCQPSPILLRGQKMCPTRDMCVNSERQIRKMSNWNNLKRVKVNWRGEGVGHHPKGQEEKTCSFSTKVVNIIVITIMTRGRGEGVSP